MTMKIKSKKLMRLAETFGETYTARRADRHAKAWRSPDGKFHLVAGYDMLPADYEEEWDSIEQLARSMRQFADLRHWVYDPEAW